MQTTGSEARRRTFAREVLVLGIGNILWADEGFGPRAAEAFHQAFRPVEGVDVMDGGTLGGFLINEITSSRRILVFDCCDFHQAPGYLGVLRGDEVGVWSSTKISPHQTGFNDLLATASMLDASPQEVAVVGVQPEELNDYGGSLTPRVKARIPESLEDAAAILKEWGFVLERRADGETVAPLAEAVLTMNAYEADRPSDADACRLGDERFMRLAAGAAMDPLGEADHKDGGR